MRIQGKLQLEICGGKAMVFKENDCQLKDGRTALLRSLCEKFDY